ncbi:TIP120 [Malassezia furfur]|nr:TIP120 [Malassezia furfur]
MVALLDKMKSPDADFRYMALMDVSASLAQESYRYQPLEESVESAVVKQVLELVVDKNSEVKNLAVKTLGALVRVQDEESRDIGSLGTWCAHAALRTLMNEIASDAALSQVAVTMLVPVLVEQLTTAAVGHAEKMHALDALLDVLSHFTLILVQQPDLQQPVLDALLGLLPESAAVSKRAIQGLGMLGVECTPAAYDELLQRGTAALTSSSVPAARTAIQLLGVLARETPLRLRPVAAARAEELLRVMASGTALDEAERDDFLEACLQTLSALVVHAIEPGTLDVGAVVEPTLGLLKYDPNAADYSDEEEEEEDDENLLDDAYTDDDDVSWKVRRASAKLLAGLCTAHLDAVRPMAYTIARALVARFGEREEGVRLEVLSTFSLLLERMTREPDVGVYKRKRDAVDGGVPLHDLLPYAVPSLCKQAGTGSAAAQIAALDTLTQLAATFGSAVAPHCATILAAVRRVLTGSRDAALHDRNRTLACVVLLSELAAAAPTPLAAEVPYVASVFVTALRAKHHRTALEALRASGALARRLVAAVGPARVAGALGDVLDAVLARLAQPDADQALREAALDTIGVLLSAARDTAVSVLALQCLYEALSLLRGAVPYEDRAGLVQHLRALPLRADAPTLEPLLALADLLVQVDPREARSVADSVLGAVLPMLGAPTFSARALDALCDLLRSLAAAEDALAPALVSAVEAAWEASCVRPARRAPRRRSRFARCLGAAAGTSAALPATLARVAALVGAPNGAAQQLGGVRRRSARQQGTLCGWPEAPAVFAQLLAAPESDARAFALGGMVLGDAALVRSLEAQLDAELVPTLRILREACAHANEEQLVQLKDAFWARLTLRAMTLPLDDEAQAALDGLCECLARLVFADATACLEQLETEVHAQHAAVRAKVLGVARMLVTLDRTHVLDGALAPRLWRYLALLGDEQLAVRRAAVLALHATVYNRVELVQEHLPALLPPLYRTTEVREELKRKVAMGPFTVITDDGLDLRKNAFETLFTLLETSLGEMRVADVVQCTVQALQDDDSVKLLGCLMLVRLADLAPTQVAPFLDTVSGPLRAIVTRKVRDNATKQEVEKANELTTAAVRVLARLAAACDVAAYPDFAALLAHTQQSPHAALLTQYAP